MNIKVEIGPENRPARFHRQGKVYRIHEIQEMWRLTGAWWDGESERTFFRVLTDKGGIYDLSYEHKTTNWAVAKVQD